MGLLLCFDSTTTFPRYFSLQVSSGLIIITWITRNHWDTRNSYLHAVTQSCGAKHVNPPRFEFRDVPRNIGTTSSAALRWYPNSNDQRPGEIIGFSSVSGRSKTADGLRNCHSDPMFSTEGLKRARQKAEIVFHPVATATTSMQVPNICLTIIHIQNASDKYMYPHPIQWFFFPRNSKTIKPYPENNGTCRTPEEKPCSQARCWPGPRPKKRLVFFQMSRLLPVTSWWLTYPPETD